jgi:hypothetical protein
MSDLLQPLLYAISFVVAYRLARLFRLTVGRLR